MDDLLPGQHIVRCARENCPGHIGLDAEDFHPRCPTDGELISLLRSALEPFAALCEGQSLAVMPETISVRIETWTIAQARNVLKGITIADAMADDRLGIG